MQCHFTGTLPEAAMPGYEGGALPDPLAWISGKCARSTWTVSPNAGCDGASMAIVAPGERKVQMKILVIDPHPLVREGLRHVLTQLCTEVTLVEAAAGHEALDQVSANPDTNFALLDLDLPDMDGFCALAALRKRCPATPVVVLSAHCDRDTVVKAIDMGAMGFISKSVGTQVILNALRLVLSGSVYVPMEALSQVSFGSGLRETKSSKGAEEGVLTKRQREVLALMAQGKSNKIICRELGLSEGTVKIHVSAILRALMVTSRMQAVIAGRSLV
jgi:DNA-binding NarL/FixJ family response regulator